MRQVFRYWLNPLCMGRSYQLTTNLVQLLVNNMDGHEAYDHWLLDTKKLIGNTTEWKSFVEELQGSLDHHLTDNHVQSFLDLEPRERLLFVDRVSKTIQSGASYDHLYGQVSLTLDQQVNNTVAKELLVNRRAIDSTKTELLMEHLKDGAVSILKRWPEMKSKLHMCLNMPLPLKLRSATWTLFMSDLNARKAYLDKLMKEPKMAVSKKDQLISETCENILKIQNTFPDIGPPSIGPFFAMKAVLSYVHAQLGSTDELHHVYYLLTLPMLHVLSPYISTNKPAANNVVAVMVEMYLTLLRDLPPYIADVRDKHRADKKTFADKVAEHLVNYDNANSTELSNYVANLSIQGQSERRAFIEKSVLIPMLSDVLMDVISPLIMSMFVGFLNRHSLMYVWDQYVIGLDVAGYHLHFMPAFTATLFILLKDDIMSCQNGPELVATVQRESHKVNVRMIQAKMKSLHYKSLHLELNQGDKAAVPVIDPTKVIDKTWNHWNNAIIPERIGIQQKQAAREARQAERERLLRMRREDELRARRDFAEQQKVAEEKLLEAAEHQKLQGEDERLEVQKQLQEERERRDARDKSYEDELDKLKKEIEALKQGKARASSVASTKSYASILAPPPTRQSAQPKFDPFYARQHTPVKNLEATDILLDVISTVANKYKILAHGTGKEARQLDAATVSDLADHEEDVKVVEAEVLGGSLAEGEFERLPEDEQTEKRKMITDAVLRRVEDRYVDGL